MLNEIQMGKDSEKHHARRQWSAFRLYQKKAKRKLKELTSRSQGRSVRSIMYNVKVFMQGWLGYYAIADMKNTMDAWNGWLRRRLRMYIRKQ